MGNKKTFRERMNELIDENSDLQWENQILKRALEMAVDNNTEYYIIKAKNELRGGE